MEKALRLHSQQFFDSENDLLCITKDFKKITFISRKWESLLGWNLEELNLKQLQELVHPEDVIKTTDKLAQAEQKNVIFGFENRWVTRTKDVKWLEWRMFYEEDEDITFILLAKDITQFREDEHYLKLSQEQAKLGTWKFNTSTEKFTGSDELFKIYEMQPEPGFSYARNASFYDEENWKQLNSAFMKCLERGTPWNIEVELITEKGNLKWVQSWGFPLMIGKEIVGVEGMLLDLTHKKNEELRLKQTVEELDKFQLSINQHSLVARLNPEGFFMDINKLFEKISGFRLGEILGKHLSEISISYFHDQIPEILKQLKQGQKWRGELKLHRKNQSLFWVDMSLTPIMDILNNELLEIVSISYDITEKKLNDERYQTVLSGINAGIWDWPDISRSEVYWSPRLFEILDYDMSSTHPSVEFFDTLTHPDDRDWLRESFQAALKADHNFLVEYRVMNGKGKYMWIQSLGIIMRDEQDRPFRMIGSITDINQKKIFEFNLEEEKQKTIQASKLATLGEMAAGLAHEVNNPLTIIFGYIRILEEELLSPHLNYELMHKHVGLIKNAAQRAAKIVTNLKDFARDGSADPFMDLPASQLISMVLDLCNERFKKNGIKIEVSISKDPIIYCRKIELSQVLLNLLFNSFDALDGKQEKWVKITAQENNHCVEICVIDSGTGLASEVAEKVFTPFFTTKKVGLGTGIGLSISQRIVLNHGGEIFYDPSSANTKFVIRLPFLQESL